METNGTKTSLRSIVVRIPTISGNKGRNYYNKFAKLFQWQSFPPYGKNKNKLKNKGGSLHLQVFYWTRNPSFSLYLTYLFVYFLLKCNIRLINSPILLQKNGQHVPQGLLAHKPVHFVFCFV